MKAFHLCTIEVNLKYILLIYLTYLTSLNLNVFWIKETYSPLQDSSAIQLTCYLCLLFFIRLVRGSAFCGLSAWTFSHSDLTILPLLPQFAFSAVLSNGWSSVLTSLDTNRAAHYVPDMCNLIAYRWANVNVRWFAKQEYLKSSHIFFGKSRTGKLRFNNLDFAIFMWLCLN